jgi:hypothetical protein
MGCDVDIDPVVAVNAVAEQAFPLAHTVPLVGNVIAVAPDKVIPSE